jgi:hypothetical protein
MSSINVDVDDDGSIEATDEEILVVGGPFTDDKTLTRRSSAVASEDSRVVTGVESSVAVVVFKEESLLMGTGAGFSSRGVGRGQWKSLN